jgi:hypothetical protein
MVVHANRDPGDVDDVIAAAATAAALLNPPHQLHVDAVWSGVSDNVHYDTMAGALARARALITAGANSVDIITYHDANGDIIPPAISNATGYTYDADDYKIRVKSVAFETPLLEQDRHQWSGFVSHVKIQVWLEGPYNTTNNDMDSGLTIPDLQPYNSFRFWDSQKYYTGGENLTSDGGFQETVYDGREFVDWVLIEVRGGPFKEHLLYRRALLIDAGGTVRDPFSIAALTIPLPPGSYYVVLRHRNHIGIMSDVPLAFAASSLFAPTWNTKSDQTNAYGGEMKLLESGVYGMYAGDGLAAEYVSSENEDMLSDQDLETGYNQFDFDMDGTVTGSGGGDADYDLWNANQDTGTNIPGG